MEKNIKLNANTAKELYGKNPKLDVILKQNFSDEELGLKKSLPKAWGEFDYIKGCFITDDSKVIKTENLLPLENNRNIFATEAQAKSAMAYAQLTQLMKEYNGNWVPDWENVFEAKYYINRYLGYLVMETSYTEYYFLAFPTAKLRDEFLKNFADLIKTFYQMD